LGYSPYTPWSCYGFCWGEGQKTQKKSKIEVRIRKLELKKKQGKLEPHKADLKVDKLKIKQAKYKE